MSNLLQKQTKFQTQKLEISINKIEEKIKRIEYRLSKIPDPFIIMYRPPGQNYKKIDEILDDIHIRIGMLEEML